MFAKLLRLTAVLAFQFILLGCVSSGSPQAMNRSYLIIEAFSATSRKQPVWIGLYNGLTYVHAEADGGIQILKPGVWAIAHFDFRKNIYSYEASTTTKRDLPFRLKAGKIYYFGLVKLNRLSGDYTIVQDPDVLKRACSENPELFRKYPLVMIFADEIDKEIRLDCDKQPQE